MSWMDQLQPASFRNVHFHVDDISHQAGDNVVVREYPFQDLPTVFRMGEGAEEIKLSAYVIGDDYIARREALREVLNGSGVLVHPTAGSIRVFVAGRYGLKENPKFEGGVARFDLTFIRAESRRYPVGLANTQGMAQSAAMTARTSAIGSFKASFDLRGLAGWVIDRVGARLLSLIGAVWAEVSDVLSVLGEIGEFASELIAGYQMLRASFNELIYRPEALAAAIAALFEQPTELTPAQAMRFQAACLPLFDMAATVVQNDFEVVIMPAVGTGLVMFGSGNASALGTDGATRASLAQLTSACDQLVETLATAAYVQATAALDLSGDAGAPVTRVQAGGTLAAAAGGRWTAGATAGAVAGSVSGAAPAFTVSQPVSYDDVMAMRATVNAQCVRLLVAGSTTAAPAALPASAWHDAVMALHTAALTDLQARSRDLVRMTTYTPQAFQPVWYVSYRLYGTAAYADEIMALNPHIRHPLLVPPGKPLRVLRHD